MTFYLKFTAYFGNESQIANKGAVTPSSCCTAEFSNKDPLGTTINTETR